MRGFYNNHPEFKGVELYIYGQSYGGKMAVDMALRMREVDGNLFQLFTYTVKHFYHQNTFRNFKSCLLGRKGRHNRI